MSDNTKARQAPKAKLRPCPFKYLGCKKRMAQNSVKRHARKCTHRPTQLAEEVQPIWKELTLHCKEKHGLDMGLALRHWKQLKLPEEHTDLSVVPSEPVYIDLWPQKLPSHSEVLNDMQATVNTAMDELRRDNPGELFTALQKMNDTLFNQMAEGSTHPPEATLRRLAVKPPTDMLSKYEFTIPPALEAMGVKDSQFDVDITPAFSITDIHLHPGGDALCLPMSGQKIVLLFKPEPPATEKNSVEAREKAWYDAWVARSVAGEREDDVSPPNCEWFQSLAGQLKHPYIAKLSSTQNKTLWIPAGWRHIVFTVSASFLGSFTFVPSPHLEKMVSQIVSECQAAARWEANNDDVLPEVLLEELHGKLDAAMQAIKTSLQDPDRHEDAKALFQKLHDNLSPKLLEPVKIVDSECQRLCGDGMEASRVRKREDGGEREDGGKRIRT